MEDKKTISLTINDLPVEATIYKDNEEEIFVPLLRHLDALQKEKQKRIIVLIGAPPGCGKSTLVTYLQQLASKLEDIQPIQAIGMDGFHHTNAYLATHHFDDDPGKPLLKTKKGALPTFDIDKLTTYLKKAKNENIIWPTYSRKLHDVSDEGPIVEANIILLEGIYLLLDLPKWKDLRDLANYTIFIDSDMEQLCQHVVDRKMAGGYSYQQAFDHFINSDRVNAQLIVSHFQPVDLHLKVDEKMFYQKVNR